MYDDFTTQLVGIVLQTQCSSALDCFGKGQFFVGLESRIAAVMGMGAFLGVVLVFGYLALQYWSKNYALPATVLVLTGGVWLSMVPPVIGRIGWIIILIAGTLGLFGLLWAVIR